MRQKQELLQRRYEGIRARKETERLKIYYGAPSEKLITCMQLCIHCGRTLPFKKGRKSCPYCQGLLRTKVIVLNTP